MQTSLLMECFHKRRVFIVCVLFSMMLLASCGRRVQDPTYVYVERLAAHEHGFTVWVKDRVIHFKTECVAAVERRMDGNTPIYHLLLKRGVPGLRWDILIVHTDVPGVVGSVKTWEKLFLSPN